MLGFSPLAAGPLAVGELDSTNYVDVAGSAALSVTATASAIAISPVPAAASASISIAATASGSSLSPVFAVATGSCAVTGSASSSATFVVSAASAFAVTAAAGLGRVVTLDPASAGVSIVGSGSLTTIEGGYDGTLEISISGSVVAGRIKTLTPAASALSVSGSSALQTVIDVAGSGSVSLSTTFVADKIFGLSGVGQISIVGPAIASIPDHPRYSSLNLISGYIPDANRTAAMTAGTAYANTVQYSGGSAAISVGGSAANQAVLSVSPVPAIVTTPAYAIIVSYEVTSASASLSVSASTPATTRTRVASPALVTASITASSPVAVRNRFGNIDATVPITVLAPTSLLRFRAVSGSAAINVTAPPVAADAIKSMTASAFISTSTNPTGVASVKMKLAAISAQTTITVASDIEPVTFSLVSASSVIGITGTLTGEAVQFVFNTATATADVSAAISAGRVTFNSGAAAAVLAGTASPRAIFSSAFGAFITANSFAVINVPKLGPKVDAIAQRYSRRVLPTGELRDTLGNEFQNIERTISSVTELTILTADAEPELKRRGMVRYAVTPWDPLSNGTTGLVVYDGNTWSAV